MISLILCADNWDSQLRLLWPHLGISSIICGANLSSAIGHESPPFYGICSLGGLLLVLILATQLDCPIEEFCGPGLVNVLHRQSQRDIDQRRLQVGGGTAEQGIARKTAHILCVEQIVCVNYT